MVGGNVSKIVLNEHFFLSSLLSPPNSITQYPEGNIELFLSK